MCRKIRTEKWGGVVVVVVVVVEIITMFKYVQV
jgi:hypothetical protein